MHVDPSQTINNIPGPAMYNNSTYYQQPGGMYNMTTELHPLQPQMPYQPMPPPVIIPTTIPMQPNFIAPPPP